MELYRGVGVSFKARSNTGASIEEDIKVKTRAASTPSSYV